MTFVEKVSRRGKRTKIWMKKNNAPFDEALSETCGTLRSDKPLLVFFFSNQETNPISFENNNSIYLRQEMRCRVRGGAAGFWHKWNLTPFQSPEALHTQKKTFLDEFLHSCLYFMQQRYGANETGNNRAEAQAWNAELDLSVNQSSAIGI